MKLRFDINQADSFRQGIDRPKSIVSIEINPADLPEEPRSIIANHLIGIDVVQLFFHHGEMIKGYPRKELSFTSQEPKRIVSKAVNIEALCDAIRGNDKLIERIRTSFRHSIQFRLIESPPANEADYEWVTVSLENVEQAAGAIAGWRRFRFEGSLDTVQTRLNELLNSHGYIVYLLPLPPSTAFARFYCEPVFSAPFLGRTVLAHTPIVVYNERTGRLVGATDLFQALDIYLLTSIRPGNKADDLSILTWEENKWVIVAPEGLINRANDAQKKAASKALLE